MQTDAARHHYPAQALCLVNLAFNAVFSRVLYNIVHVEEYADDTAASLRMLQQAAQSQHLAATKTLEIVFLDHTGTCRKKNSINHGNLKRFRALIADVFNKMPNLARLHWYVTARHAPSLLVEACLLTLCSKAPITQALTTSGCGIWRSCPSWSHSYCTTCLPTTSQR